MLTGNEHFLYNGVPINRLLLDFWAWQASDLLSNTLRGALAEYIVATALDIDTKGSRTGFFEYDLLYGDIRIEVKSSAYLQTWERDGFSRISFNIYQSHPASAMNVMDYESEPSSAPPGADIYVFCLFNEKDRDTANPMLLEQWTFYVVRTDDINRILGSQKTASLSTLESLPHIECTYEDIRSAVDSLSMTA